VETAPCLLCGRHDARPVRTATDRLASAHGGLAAPTAAQPATVPDMGRGDEEATTFSVVRCRGCGLAYLDPRPTVAEIGHYYPDDYHTARGAGGLAQRLEYAWRRRQFGEVEGWLADLRPGRGRLLDVGCGSGELLEALRADGWSVSGVEPSARSAEIARAQRGLDVQTATFDDALLPEGSFEAVVFAAALEHLHDPLAALQRARRLLAPDGLVAVLFLPCFDAPRRGSLERAGSGSTCRATSSTSSPAASPRWRTEPACGWSPRNPTRAATAPPSGRPRLCRACRSSASI
jgi:hypothetical protein